MLKNLAMCLRRTCISLESSGDVEDIIVEWFIKLLCEREKGLGAGLQEGFVVASVDGVVGRLREAHGGIRETLDETEEHGHAVEGGGEGDKGQNDEGCVGSALNLESCEKCHNINIIMSCFVVESIDAPGTPHAALRVSGGRCAVCGRTPRRRESSRWKKELNSQCVSEPVRTTGCAVRSVSRHCPFDDAKVRPSRAFCVEVLWFD